jgi:beta-galactosidase
MRRLTLIAAALIALPLALHPTPGAPGAQPGAPGASPLGTWDLAPKLFAQEIQVIAQSPRTTAPFTTGWRFLQSDAPGAQDPAFNDASWAPVTLPHDWAIAGEVKEDAPTRGAGAFKPAGIGWYRKTFTVPDADAAPTAPRRTFVVFDGVMANSDVYLNGALLGHRPYGYVSFVYELTPHLHAGPNVLAVRVDNSQQPASRWYPGAGINRQVRLITTGDAHIVPWGTVVSTPNVSAASANVHVVATVTNESAAPAHLTLRVRLTGPTGAPVTTKDIVSTQPLDVSPGATADLDLDTQVPHPDRWDIAHGAIYTAHATLLKDNQPIDAEDVPFGIREFHFDPNQGFFLNGVHHKIFGVAMHTDDGALGTAVPLAAWQRRFEILRTLGVNAIRTSHNPPAPEFLALADRMGFLVMDEMFDCWTVAKNPYDYHLYFRDWYLRDTTDTVMRDRNHPSIILWSAGNEIHDTPNPAVAIPILTNLVKTFHQYDPTRPVTEALFRPNASHDYEDGLADLLDVIGQNYRPDEILAAHAQKPTRSIVGTENTHELSQWVPVRDHPEYSGEFLWAGIDYLGESGSWPTIGSGSGLILSTGMLHGRAYQRQSWWSTTPMVAVVRRVAQARAAAIDPGYANATTMNQAADAVPAQRPATPAAGAPGAQRPPRTAAAGPPRFGDPLLADWTPKDLTPHTENLEVYTNAQEVELFLNGKSLGTQKLHPDASPIPYAVPFEPGTLKAVARTSGKVVATQVLKTAGPPARLQLTTQLDPYRLTPAIAAAPLTPTFDDVRYLTATLVDADGTPIPDSATLVHFTVTGPAALVAVDNGNMNSHEAFQGSERTLYNGNAFAILRATASSGAITVTAAADGLPPATLHLTAAPPAKEDPTLAAATTNRSF